MSAFIPLKICTESVLVLLSCCHHENKLLLKERKVRHSYALSLVLTLNHIEEFLKYFMLPEKNRWNKSWITLCHAFLFCLVKRMTLF